MTRPRRPCLDCGAPTTSARCTACRRQASRARNAQPHRATRWGADHRTRRRTWEPLVATGTVTCARCGRLIAAGAAWDLDHLDNGTSRPSCATCNRSAGGANGGRTRTGFLTQAQRRQPGPAAGTVPTSPEGER